MVNPVIEPLDDELVEINEGCLSVPNLRGNVLRHVNVRVRYLDRDGVAHDEVKRGLTAGTFQHECDHLDGVLFLDRVIDTAHVHDVGAVRALPPRTRSSSGSPSSSHRVGSLSAVDGRYHCELAWLGGDGCGRPGSSSTVRRRSASPRHDRRGRPAARGGPARRA